MPDGDAHLIDPHGSWMTNKRGSQQRKPKASQVQKAAKKSINDTTLPSSRLSSGVSMSSKLQVMKSESLPTQMKDEPLYDTSAFQFMEELKPEGRKE